MGSGMAGNLIAAGHEVHGFAISGARMDAFTEAGGVAAGSAAEVAKRADVVVFSLASVEALVQVTTEIAAAGRSDLVCIETGTLPMEAKLAARDRLQDAGIVLLDSPLSGTGFQAADATLVIFASGPVDVFERARFVFDAIGRKTYHVGDFGNGSVMKYIANLLVAIHNISTAEAHALGYAAGMDPAMVQEVMSEGFGASKVFDIRGPMMVADTYEPPSAAMYIARKDSHIIADFARSVGVDTPMLDATIPVYDQAGEAGLGGVDPAVLFRVLTGRDYQPVGGE
jgi:3-hydroxyisobutyrate dehydrogenase-like beta-hydroxyacid dehydrogenase